MMPTIGKTLQRKGSNMNYINSITEAIGKTPLLKLNKIGKDVPANVFVKLEHLNPSGSYKDRMALSMVEAAEKGLTWNGKKLPSDGTVVEASAGNTAPAVAMVCAAKGYKARLVLYRYQFDGGETTARMKIIQAFGPEVGISSEPTTYLSQEQLEEIFAQHPNMNRDLPHVLAAKMDCYLAEQNDPKCIWVDQIYNEHNYIGQMNMGREIYDQLDGKIDAIGCSVSAGGSFYGICLGLEEKGLRVPLTFGVVPEGSEHYFELQGVENDRGEFEISDVQSKICETMGLKKWVTEKPIVNLMFEAGYPDKFFLVSDEEARNMANRLCQEEGIYCGMSSGANVAIALKIAQRLEPGSNVVSVIVDRRDRYLSEYPHDKYVV
jgi:cysteine synthase